MLSFCSFNYGIQIDVNNNVAALKSCYQVAMSSCNTSVNKAILFHRRFGHPNYQALMQILKNDKSIHIFKHHLQ